MLRTLPPLALALCILLAHRPGFAETLTELKSLKLDVPSSDLMFPGPGADEINNNCVACHSADHVLNQPSLSREAWEEVVNKMIRAYKAPVSPEDAEKIVDYLTRTKGAP